MNFVQTKLTITTKKIYFTKDSPFLILTKRFQKIDSILSGYTNCLFLSALSEITLEKNRIKMQFALILAVSVCPNCVATFSSICTGRAITWTPWIAEVVWAGQEPRGRE